MTDTDWEVYPDNVLELVSNLEVGMINLPGVFCNQMKMKFLFKTVGVGPPPAWMGPPQERSGGKHLAH